MRSIHAVRRAGMIPALISGTLAGSLIAGALLHGQERQGLAPTDPDPATVDPPKKVLETKPRKQVSSEIIPPVNVGMVLETTADGVLVRRVAPESPAGEAGMMPDDLILRIAGKQVLTPVAIDRRFHNYKPGTKLEVVALRKAKEFVTTIVLPKDHQPLLLEKPEPPQKAITVIERPVPVATTVVVKPAAPDLGWVLQERDEQVWVTDVRAGSIAEAAGLRRGDQLVQLNKELITGLGPMESRLSILQPGAVATFEVHRGDRALPIALSMPTTQRAAAGDTRATTAPANGPAVDELLRRQLVIEEMLTKCLAELQSIRAELKTRR